MTMRFLKERLGVQNSDFNAWKPMELNCFNHSSTLGKTCKFHSETGVKNIHNIIDTGTCLSLGLNQFNKGRMNEPLYLPS